MPSFGTRVSYAFRCFFAILFSGTIAARLARGHEGRALRARARAGRGAAPAAAPAPARRTRASGPSSCSPSSSATVAWWTSCARTSRPTPTRRSGPPSATSTPTAAQVLERYLPRRVRPRRRGGPDRGGQRAGRSRLGAAGRQRRPAGHLPRHGQAPGLARGPHRAAAASCRRGTPHRRARPKWRSADRGQPLHRRDRPGDDQLRAGATWTRARARLPASR